MTKEYVPTAGNRITIPMRRELSDKDSFFFSILSTMSKQLPRKSQLTKTEIRILTYMFVHGVDTDHFRGDARYELMRTMDFSTHNLSVHTAALRDKGWIEPFSYERIDSRGKLSMCDSWKISSALIRTLGSIDTSKDDMEVSLSIKFTLSDGQKG